MLNRRDLCKIIVSTTMSNFISNKALVTPQNQFADNWSTITNIDSGVLLRSNRTKCITDTIYEPPLSNSHIAVIKITYSDKTIRYFKMDSLVWETSDRYNNENIPKYLVVFNDRQAELVGFQLENNDLCLIFPKHTATYSNLIEWSDDKQC